MSRRSNWLALLDSEYSLQPIDCDVLIPPHAVIV